MVRCTRCCIHKALRGVNVFVNLCGVGIIIYSLWLEKMWEAGLSELPSFDKLPKPWHRDGSATIRQNWMSVVHKDEMCRVAFILLLWNKNLYQTNLFLGFIIVCFGVGIAVCLSTLCGFMVANCVSNSSLCIYIISICSLVFLEGAVLVLIFFKMDWSKLLYEYIGEHHKKFQAFVTFHLVISRLIVITALILQIVVVAFALILWAVGTKPRAHGYISAVPDFRQSFLVAPNTPIINDSEQFCTKCGDFCGRNPRESFLSYIEGIIRSRFRRRTIDHYPEISG